MTQNPIQLLAVLQDEWRKSLTDALAPVEVRLWTASDWQSALTVLKANPEIEVAICASVLSDATSKHILADVSALERPVQVLIAARYADPSLWYEVLEDGAYDLIVYPFCSEVLLQTLLSASADCQFERDRKDCAVLRNPKG